MSKFKAYISGEKRRGSPSFCSRTADVSMRVFAKGEDIAVAINVSFDDGREKFVVEFLRGEGEGWRRVLAMELNPEELRELNEETEKA